MSSLTLTPVQNVSEAAVALRLASCLVSLPGSSGLCRVAIDGAQVMVDGREIFPIDAYLDDHGWRQTGQAGKNPWQGRYEKGGRCFEIGAFPGVGDVSAQVGEKRIRAECKKGFAEQHKGNPEYPKLREALGQLLTVEDAEASDILVAAVPDTPAYRRLAENWRDRPLIGRTGIQIVLVGSDGIIDGLTLR